MILPCYPSKQHWLIHSFRKPLPSTIWGQVGPNVAWWLEETAPSVPPQALLMEASWRAEGWDLSGHVALPGLAACLFLQLEGVPPPALLSRGPKEDTGHCMERRARVPHPIPVTGCHREHAPFPPRPSPPVAGTPAPLSPGMYQTQMDFREDKAGHSSGW